MSEMIRVTRESDGVTLDLRKSKILGLSSNPSRPDGGSGSVVTLENIHGKTVFLAVTESIGVLMDMVGTRRVRSRSRLSKGLFKNEP